MSDVTRLLHRVRAGDRSALDELMPLVHGELRRIARAFMRRQRPGHTLQPTALVNEAFIKLFDNAKPEVADRAHFLALMSRVMRQCWWTTRDRLAPTSAEVARRGCRGTPTSKSGATAERFS